MKKYLVISTHEHEEPFEIEAENKEQANDIALQEIGWHTIEIEED